MKRTIGLVTLITVLVAAFALTGSTEPTTLRLTWWGNQTRNDQTIEVIELFEKKNPGYKVKPEYTSWAGYWDRMAAQAAGSNLADIMQQDFKYITQYAESGQVIPLDPYINKGLNLRDVEDTFIEPGKINGKLYGVNLGANTYVFAYDPAMFAKAKVKEPNPDWTWEEYLDTCKKLRKGLKMFADNELGFATNNISGLEHYVRQRGQQIFDPSGKKLAFDPKLFIEFYKMDLDLTKEKVFAPPEVRLEVTSVENNLLVTNKAALSSVWTNQIVAFTNAAQRPLKMALFPKDKKQVKEGTYLKPSMFFSITKDCKNRNAAVKFIDFFINDVEVNKILKAERGVPISSKVRAAMASELDETGKAMFEIIDLAGKHSSAIDPPPPAAFKQVIDVLNDVHYKMLYKVITLDQGAKEFFDRSNKILAEAL